MQVSKYFNLRFQKAVKLIFMLFISTLFMVFYFTIQLKIYLMIVFYIYGFLSFGDNLATLKIQRIEKYSKNPRRKSSQKSDYQLFKF